MWRKYGEKVRPKFPNFLHIVTTFLTKPNASLQDLLHLQRNGQTAAAAAMDNTWQPLQHCNFLPLPVDPLIGLLVDLRADLLVNLRADLLVDLLAGLLVDLLVDLRVALLVDLLVDLLLMYLLISLLISLLIYCLI